MTTTRAYNLPIHNHPLFPSPLFRYVECKGCHVKEPIYGGYICNEPNCCSWFHKECAEAPPEINHHPSHLEHPLLLLTNDSQSKDSPCDCCGKNLLSPSYTCSTCEFKLDLICGMKPSPPAIENPMCHDHSLVFLKKREVEVPCEACKESIGGPSYSCLECHNVYFHLDCVHLSKEVNHICHPSHPLKAVASESFTDNLDVKKSCRFCEVQPEKMMYHCSVCNFTMCFGCTKHPPPLVVEDTMTHTHPLRLLLNRIAFTCKVCGIEGYVTKPYICLECDFVVHGNCIGFYRVININRHDHRISFTHHLDRQGTKCGVCWRNVSQYYGAYLCSVCPNYTVHSLCALDFYVWNGVELEGIPEKNEDTPPFKVVGHNLIRHFSHSEHTLRLLKDDVDIQDDECIRCQACIRPVRVGPIYSCKKCWFVLHEKCANFPMKKRLVFDVELYTLVCDDSTLYCKLCGMLCSGFMYTSQGLLGGYQYIDVHCGTLSEPFLHNAHSHPLYFVTTKDHCCDICKRVPRDYMLRCDECDFDLCLYCATLPEEICHMKDDHPLTLYNGGKGSGTNWCEVCEMELDPSKWFYTCSDCEVALHVQCVGGDFSRLKPGWLYTFGERDYKVVLNNNNTRPFCSHCHSRCKAPLILKDKSKDSGYICSLSCFSSCLGIKLGYLPRTEM